MSGVWRGARRRVSYQAAPLWLPTRRLHALPRLRLLAAAPRRGEIEVTDEICEEHGLPHLRVHSGDEPWELGCPICNYREFTARQEGSELQTVEGIGEKTAEKLKDAGVDGVDDLKSIDPDELAADVDGVGADTVRDWQAKAD